MGVGQHEQENEEPASVRRVLFSWQTIAFLLLPATIVFVNGPIADEIILHSRYTHSEIVARQIAIAKRPSKTEVIFSNGDQYQMTATIRVLLWILSLSLIAVHFFVAFFVSKRLRVARLPNGARPQNKSSSA
jgi:hypothetical protein